MHLIPDIGYLFDSTSGRVYNSRHVMRSIVNAARHASLDYEP